MSGPGLPRELLEQILADVPEIPRFLTVKELDERTLELARSYRGALRVRRIGQSAHGEPLLALEAGEGSRTAILFGGPHPNEPVGTLTALHLAEGLGRHDEAFRGLGIRFLFVPVVDRSGMQLNERWLASPAFSFAKFARGYYRPPAGRQVEWSFPYYSAEYDFSATRPETQALQHLIDTHRPSFVYSLHNSNVGGAFYYLNRPLAELQERLLDYPRKLGLPLDPVRPEVPWGEILAPFILRRLATHDAVRYLVDRGLNPRELLLTGAGSLEYAESVNPGVLGMMAEVPLFADARCADPTPSQVEREELERESRDAREKVETMMRSAYHTIQREGGGLRPGAFRDCLESGMHQHDVTQRLRPKEHSPRGAASTSEVFHARVLERFLDLRLLGLLHRFIQEQGAPGTFAREGLLSKTDDQIEVVSRKLEVELKGKKVPLRDLVRVQMSAGLHALAHLDDS